MSVQKFLIQNRIKFKNISIFEEAFTHPSYTNENTDSPSYQRMEFLGDSILSLYCTEKIYIKFPKMTEGEMSLLRAKMVNKDALASLSEKLKLSSFIRFGNGLKTFSDKCLSDIFESLVGAIYLDQGAKSIYNFLDKHIYHLIIKSSKSTNLKNPKTLLQEFLQTDSREGIQYTTKMGKNNNFVSTIKHEGNNFGEGKGKTKKEAEKNAAVNALDKLGQE